MANLKGSNYDKQVTNAFHRLEAFKVKRHGTNSHKTHSLELAKKRVMYLNDYIKFVNNLNLTEKLNQTMTHNNIDIFLNQRLEKLSLKSKEDYVRGWSSMIQGLNEVNVSIPIDKEYFNDKINEIKSITEKEPIKINRAIKNVSSFIQNLYDKRFESGVLAQIQYELGFRVSEAIKLISNPLNYIKNNSVTGMIGKGNHKYHNKIISKELQSKISIIENIPSQNTYRNDIKELSSKYSTHSLRYNYAKNEFNKKIEQGISYKQALKEVSEGLNHSRIEMSKWYLLRA